MRGTRDQWLNKVLESIFPSTLIILFRTRGSGLLQFGTLAYCLSRYLLNRLKLVCPAQNLSLDTTRLKVSSTPAACIYFLQVSASSIRRFRLLPFCAALNGYLAYAACSTLAYRLYYMRASVCHIKTIGRLRAIHSPVNCRASVLADDYATG